MRDQRLTAALDRCFADIGDVVSLDELDRVDDRLRPAHRVRLVEQAIAVLDDFYVHLPMKRASHALDPVQRLRLLRHRLDGEELDDRAFHRELLGVFKNLRDNHTNYFLPEPYASMVAFLPFILDRYGKPDDPRFVVTRLLHGLEEHEGFRPGTEITHWNGTPILRAVLQNGEREAGSNRAAQLAYGLMFMTVRWLGASQPPDEEWVTLGYRDGNRQRELTFPWKLLRLRGRRNFKASIQVRWLIESTLEQNLHLGVSTQFCLEHLARRELFKVRELPAPEPAQSPVVRRSEVEVTQNLRDVFECCTLKSDDFGATQFGYIRIRAFASATLNLSPEVFVGEFRRILKRLPPRGLIIDIRGNPGGDVRCAERILQLLTPRTITPVPFQFISTPSTIKFVNSVKGYRQHWGESMALSLSTGVPFSNGFPITSVKQANGIGQEYYGPTLLIVDALSYSAADILAAGFADHEIGDILGVDKNTGAGGANVWRHKALQIPEMSDEIKELPRGAILEFAARRCLRVGPRAGVLLEELGVRPNHLHHPTKDDVLGRNDDLLHRAMKLLIGRPARTVAVQESRSRRSVNLDVTVEGADRLDLYIDKRPQGSREVPAGGRRPIRFTLPSGRRAEVELRAYARDKLVARKRYVVKR